MTDNDTADTEPTDDESTSRPTSESSSEPTDEPTDDTPTNDTGGTAEQPSLPPTLLVTATNERSGKTALTLALGRIAQSRGLSVRYMKPKGTRLESVVGKTLDMDPMLAREVLGLDQEIHEMEPVVYSPTFVEGVVRGKERPAALHEEIRSCFDALASDADLILVEGGARHTTGGVADISDPDVAALLDARCLVVGEYTDVTDLDDLLAAVSDVRSGSEALVDAEAARTPEDRLVGVVFNRVRESLTQQVDADVTGFLRARDVAVQGILPRVRELSGVTVSQLASELGAERLTDPTTDDGRPDFVDRFHVGAMGGDAALRHFRRTRDAAVVTGGDRTDVQTAAIEATGITCLVVTGGIRPPGSILGRAAEAGLPVLAVDVDTLTAVERTEAIVSGGRTRDAFAVERMVDLLERHADVDAILGT